MSVGTVAHFGVIFPNTTQHVVIFSRSIRVTRDTVVVVVINESSHTETLVIDNAIAEVHTIDSHLVGFECALEEFVTITNH